MCKFVQIVFQINTIFEYEKINYLKMQKIFNLLLITLFINFNLLAQSPNNFIKIEFVEKIMNRVDSVQQNLKYRKYKQFTEQKCVLYVGKNTAYYTFNFLKSDKEKYAEILNKNTLDPIILKNKETINAGLNKLSTLKEFNRIYIRKLNSKIIKINNYLETGNTYDKYYIEDTLEKIEWKLIDARKNIANFSCQKALGTFRGRFWEVWFTMQIPIPVGPWKLGGLPGLILEAKDSTSLYSYIVNSIENPIAEPIDGSLLLNDKVKKVSNKEWLNFQYLNKLEFQKKMEQLFSIFDIKDTAKPIEEGSANARNQENFRVMKLEFKLPYAPLEY